MTSTEQIYEIVRQLAADRDTFTPDDVRPLLPEGVSPRAIAPVFNKARRDGLIEEVGRVKSQVPGNKGRLIAVYSRPGSNLAIAESSNSKQEHINLSGASKEIKLLRDFLEDRGYLCGVEEIAAILLMLAARQWLVLSGPSGTGKSSIIRFICSALGGELHDIQVKPNWLSSEDTLGYFSEMSQNFIPGVLTSALIAAQNDERLHFVRFDEMNLASPEYYLAEVLSAAEGWRKDENGEYWSDEIQLPPVPDGVEVPRVRLSDRVFLVGTVNIDETTRPLSPKVLDRAAVYDLHHVDLSSIPSRPISEVNQSPGSFPSLRSLLEDRPHTLSDLSLPDGLVAELGDLLEGLNAYSRVLGGPIAYRQRDALLNMVTLAEKHGLSDILTKSTVVDIGLRSCVVPKWQGSTHAGLGALRGAIAFLLEIDSDASEITPEIARSRIPNCRYPRTTEKLIGMLEQAIDLGYFDSW
ncbi:hypothetical protein MHAS_04556 [Mycolicibacterium hassiacum DSM 44199]|uniref:AAA family ATPase n=2 Tax=Mycolicibacterium hassiacum TaxID=46351 RepID=UPI000A689682|nr:AAA family ATPase [Mycolicibacterium hassiacum]VCT92821.1 hypothetical protein MHAS_04556 [Mycolicibacterium hassiacum DSM 44199]